MVNDADLAVCSVLSGNRNFEGRINPDVKMNYLASPPLVVAYALAGTMDVDLQNDPLGEDADGEPVYLRDIWPSAEEVARTIEQAVQSDMFVKSYDGVYAGDERWRGLEVADGRPLRVGRQLDLRAEPAVLRRHAARAAPVTTSRARASWRCSATPSRPTTSRPPARSSRTVPPGATCRSTASSARTSTPTARGAATTR